MHRSQAFLLQPSSLPVRSIHDICQKYVVGDCSDPHCDRSHDICLLQEPEENIHSIPARNTLDINKQSPMRQSQSYNPFDEDGPGTLSQLGPRHDNDHVSITNIRILPTTDEILSDRKPYMPIADYTNDKHDWSRTVGPQRMIVRVIDKNFRQLRYDSINCIIKACRDAMRMLLLPSPIQQGKEYAVTNQTTCGTRFHLFRGVIFEELLFHDRKGINFRVSFDCPPSLRSHRIHHKSTKLLENGKLVALVGIEKVSGNLTTTFFEIHMRESTDAMHSTTGNHDRAAVQLTLADRDDVESLRKMLYFQKGILEGKFALIDFADFLLTGFAPHLQCLKSLASWPTIAFDDTIAPECHESVVVKPIEPPSYAAKNFFKFDLSGLRTSEASKTDTKLEIDAAAISRSGEVAPAILSTIKSETTLDDGQAQALVEMLCRGIAFTQGPPGTGKSFLGVALSKVLLDSQDFQSQKPIVVVCKTNHALDSFLEDLLKKGIKDIIRIGQAGDKEWAAQFQLHAQTTKLRLPQSDYNKLASANRRLHEISREALSWIENLNSETLGWAILRDHLRVHHPTFYTEFVKFEIANKNVRDLRKVRHFKGFAFDYWVRGGDLDDVDGILDAVATLLKESNASMSSEYSARFQEQVLGNMRSSISGTSDVSSQSVWGLKVAKRQTLTKQWIKEMDATKLCDSMTEMHRRHQELLRSSNTHWDSKKSLMLSTKEVVGLTTTGFAQHYDLLRTLQPRIILMEEAAEVLEAHTLLTLGFTSIEHHLSIGDPLQLRPQNEESVLSTDNAIGKKYRLDESLFERLMKPTSSSYPAVPVSQLNIQRRMHPDVADISRATLYDYLVDHESTRSHPEVAGMSDRMYWFDHCVPEDPPCPGTALAGSSSNEFEVDMTVALVKYLSSTGAYGLGDIAIVTAYNRQLARLTLRLQRECNVKVWLSETDKELLIDRGILDEEALSTSEQDIGLHNMLRVATIDGFQGEEAKVVIFSTVRSNSTSTVGFLSNINRVNVACSRARDGFYVIGNASAVGHVPIWNRIINVFRTKGKIGHSFKTLCSRHPCQFFHVGMPQGFLKIPPCAQICGASLQCGHNCNRTCHELTLHDIMPCEEQCEKLLPCSHYCQGICGRPCPDCQHEDRCTLLGCGHTVQQKCGEFNRELKPRCSELLEMRRMPCGHNKAIICSSGETQLNCGSCCETQLGCGHFCEGVCSKCSIEGHYACRKQCKHQLSCGHPCVSQCDHVGPHSPCNKVCAKGCQHGKCNLPCTVECTPCIEKTTRICPHMAPQELICCLDFARVPCSEPCDRLLSCAIHFCSGFCGEQCPKTCHQCSEKKVIDKPHMYLPCGHLVEAWQLDIMLNLQSVYEMVNHRPTSGRVVPMPDPATMKCPECRQHIREVSRYSLLENLPHLGLVVDKLLALCDRKLSNFQRAIFNIDAFNLGTSSGFCNMLTNRRGSLAERRISNKVWARTEAFLEVHGEIRNFLEEVVGPIAKSLDQLCELIRNERILPKMTLTFELRCELLFFLCRLGSHQEAMRIYEKLRTINSSSRIASIVRASLRLKILDQANTYSVSLAELIDRCHFAYLKRLEVELRLIDIAFRSMSSRLLDVESPIRNDPIVASIDRVKQLCGTFPDTAGLFAPLYLELDLVVKNGQALLSIQGWASELASGLWHGFSKANPNYRVVCPYRHPYFESTFSDCPECGREVVYQPTKDADPVGAKPQLLGSNDFFAMINVKKRVTSLALSSGSTSTTKVTCSDKEEILMEEKNVIISEKEVEIWD